MQSGMSQTVARIGSGNDLIRRTYLVDEPSIVSRDDSLAQRFTCDTVTRDLACRKLKNIDLFTPYRAYFSSMLISNGLLKIRSPHKMEPSDSGCF
jgi:hypothetical protein